MNYIEEYIENVSFQKLARGFDSYYFSNFIGCQEAYDELSEEYRAAIKRVESSNSPSMDDYQIYSNHDITLEHLDRLRVYDSYEVVLHNNGRLETERVTRTQIEEEYYPREIDKHSSKLLSEYKKAKDKIELSFLPKSEKVAKYIQIRDSLQYAKKNLLNDTRKKWRNLTIRGIEKILSDISTILNPSASTSSNNKPEVDALVSSPSQDSTITHTNKVNEFKNSDLDWKNMKPKEFIHYFSYITEGRVGNGLEKNAFIIDEKLYQLLRIVFEQENGKVNIIYDPSTKRDNDKGKGKLIKFFKKFWEYADVLYKTTIPNQKEWICETFTFNGKDISPEFFRSSYRSANTHWEHIIKFSS